MQTVFDILICCVIGYFMGCLSPSYLIAKYKNRDIQKSGTGNLGATNTFLHFGAVWGGAVLIFDMAKAFIAVKLAECIFPESMIAGVIAGGMAVIGHIFPFYLKFKGGKGLACFGGLILALSWQIFLVLLTIGILLAIIMDFACVIPISSAILFPIIYAIKVGNVIIFILLAICSTVIIYKHYENIKRIKKGEELSIRAFVRQKFFVK